MTSPSRSDHAPRERESQRGHAANRPDDTAQKRRDAEEKRHHPASENDLDTAQDKNPVPPGTVRE